MKRSLTIALLIASMLPCLVHAQPNPITLLPNNVPPAAFNDWLHPRPRLSILGFDNTQASADYTPIPGRGLGVRQILDQVYVTPDPLVREVYIDILQEARRTIAGVNDANQRSVIYSARAFEALMSYILEQNGYAATDMQLVQVSQDAASFLHAEALSRLSEMKDTDTIRAYCTQLVDPLAPCIGYDPDPVQAVESIANTARGYDLYAALETAYDHFGDDVGALRAQVLGASRISDLRTAYGDMRDAANSLAGEKQPGNWPMKMHLVAAYAMLSLRADDIGEPAFLIAETLDEATHSASDGHWMNQTGVGGRRFWAEGAYYLQFALMDVVPYWHTMRALYMPATEPNDPFQQAWFLEPLEWLADTSEPGGFSIPLDDGNKFPLAVSSMLRWAPEYVGSNIQGQRVGEKFATINQNLIRRLGYGTSVGSHPSLRLVEIAMPRTAVTTPLPTYLPAQTGPQVINEDAEQQLVIRRQVNGEEHYIVLNGENGNAIVGGEGHEQPDNMQLLYSIDEHSFLLDSGYDSATWTHTSKWNHYFDHNVMASMWDEGGIYPPDLKINLTKQIDAHDVDALFRTQEGNIDILHGIQFLPAAFFEVDHGQAPAYYYRDVLFIDGPDPYLIDFNRAYHDLGYAQNVIGDRQFKVSYNGNSNSLALNNFDPRSGAFISWSNIGGSSTNLYAYPVSVEYPVKSNTSDVISHQDTHGEDFGQTKDFKNLVIRDVKIAGSYRNYFSLASIIQARSSAPTYAPTLLWEDYTQDTHRGWVWQQDANTFDVFVARSVQPFHTPDDLFFNLRDVDPAFPIAAMELPAASDYGFARVQFNAVSGMYEALPNYVVGFNVVPPVVYSSNTTESASKTFFTDQIVRVNAGVTVTFDGLVTLQPGVIFDLYDGAQVNFDAGVNAQGTPELPIQFIATGTVRPDVALRGSSSTLAEVQFEGYIPYSAPLWISAPSLTLANDALATISGTSSFHSGISLANASELTIAAYATTQVASIGVEWGARLTIRKGVDIYTDFGLGAGGVIEILGTINDPIDIRPLNNPTWEEIYLSGGYTSGSRFEYVRLFDTRKGIYAKKGSNMTLKAVKAYGVGDECSTTLMLMSGVTVNQSRFTGSTYGLCSYMSSVGLVSSSVDNHFYNNSSAGLWASGASTVVFGAHSVPAHISSYGNATGLLVEDQTTVKIGEWIPYSQVVRGGTNTVYNNTAYDVEAHNYGLVFAEYTWWGQAVPQTSQFMSTGDSEINYDNPLTSQPTLPPTSAYSSIEPVLAKREMVQVHPQTQQLTGLTLAGVATLSRLTKAGYIEEMRRLRAQQGRGASLAALTSYVQERGSQDRLATVSQLLRLEDMVALGHVEAAIGQAKALRARGTLEPTEQEQVGVLLFLAYLDGKRDVEAAEAELKALPDRGRTRTVAHVLQHLLDKAKGASGDAWSKRGLTRSTPPREAVPAEMLHQQDVVADASSETIASAAEVSVYPNPFNPSTMFAYRVPEAANVRLSVYDMVGREVAVLVEGVEQAGVHNVSFDGTQLASGLYLYQLRVGGEVLTGRIHLLK